jgi:GNAT superfamily N-acetyltransferase
MEIRPLESSDVPFLWDMLWEAASIAEEVQASGKETGLANPKIRRYLADWERNGDRGIVALDESGQRDGAIWMRLFAAEAPGYGSVASDIPELAIGVVADFRGCGIGGALLDDLLATARAHGFRAVSIAVDRRSPAVALYKHKGVNDAGVSLPTDTGLTMIAWLETHWVASNRRRGLRELRPYQFVYPPSRRRQCGASQYSIA